MKLTKISSYYLSSCGLFLSLMILSISLVLLLGCEQEQVPDAPLQEGVESPFAKTSETEILQQYPDDLDEALQELELIEE